tara:strand:- start:715 stop:1035 length:321 start_codon:yes stop_codon:yes gene_type:complete
MNIDPEFVHIFAIFFLAGMSALFWFKYNQFRQLTLTGIAQQNLIMDAYRDEVKKRLLATKQVNSLMALAANVAQNENGNFTKQAKYLLEGIMQQDKSFREENTSHG